MEATSGNPWHIVSHRPSNGPFSSLASMFKKVDNLRKSRSNYDRPPFPIIIDKPTISDVFNALKFSDYCMFGMVYGVGFPIGFVASRPFMLIS